MLFPEDLRSDTEIANEFPVLFKTVLAEKMEPESRIRGDEGSVEYRVQVPSKRRVIDQIDRYQQVIKRVLDGQEDVGPDTRRMLLQELLAVRHAVSMMLTGSRTHRHNTGRGLCDLRQSFEAGVQENVLVDGRPWDEAPDVEELESLLDDAIVDTSWRRRCYPRQILPHVIHALKAERKLMVLFEHHLKPPPHTNHPDQEAIMKDLSAAAPVMVKQAQQVVKSIRTLHQQAEGLREVLNMNSSSSSVEIHREVLGCGSRSHDFPAAVRSRQEMKRSVEDAAAADGYVSAKRTFSISKPQ
ncbi:kinetochore-associated protein NSL1 homolog isoform X1 [Antennarius striatus]|uniref:kinetochore-associated protein NSL1 homolog isoform X1 n=1 Tax=Antennarius striatus TaxID=241820 RepID=UPI0035B49670